MKLIIHGGYPLKGKITVPADKSITHRSLMLSSIAKGVTRVLASHPGEDNHTTASVMRQLGVRIDDIEGGWKVHGVGKTGLRTPTEALDCGNSGTTIRLLSGLLCGAGVAATLVGDSSLEKRPMGRICKPLRAFNAKIEGSRTNVHEHAPLVISKATMRSGCFRQPIASAQVKSCLLFAGLMSEEEIEVWEPSLSRDHSERMLNAMGVRVETAAQEGGWIGRLHGSGAIPKALGEIRVPGDISSAAFWAAAALLIPGSELLLNNVGLNSSRTGCLEALCKFGYDYELREQKSSGGEQVGSLKFLYDSQVVTNKEVVLEGSLIPRLVDELVVLGAVAMGRNGSTTVKDAEELRVKESDRISETARILRAFGAHVRENSDGYTVDGPASFRAANVNVGQDHRIALTSAILAAAAPGTSTLENFEIANISYPSFLEDFRTVGAEFEVEP